MTTLRRRTSTKSITWSAYRQAIERMSAELDVLIRQSPTLNKSPRRDYPSVVSITIDRSVREHWRMTVSYLNRLYGIDRLEGTSAEVASITTPPQPDEP